MKNKDEDFYNGTRVMVFDPTLFIDDKKTPLSITVKPATVVCWYGKWNHSHEWTYPNLIDVLFDHRPERVSHGHFVDYVEKI